MNWNKDKFQSLVRERTSQVPSILPPSEPQINSDFGHLTKEEIELSSILSYLAANGGVVSTIRQAIIKLAELSPEITLVEKSQLTEAEEYVKARMEYQEAYTQWKERVGWLDMECDTDARLPILSVVSHHDSSPKLVVEEHYFPGLLNQNGTVSNGSEFLNNYSVPQEADIENFIASIDPNEVRNTLRQYLGGRQLEELDGLLAEPVSTPSDEATEQQPETTTSQTIGEDSNLDEGVEASTAISECTDPKCPICR